MNFRTSTIYQCSITHKLFSNSRYKQDLLLYRTFNLYHAISLPRRITSTARPILLFRFRQRDRNLTSPQRTTTVEMILLPSPCDIDGHILQLLRLRRFRGLHQYGSTTALVTAIIVNLYVETAHTGRWSLTARFAALSSFPKSVSSNLSIPDLPRYSVTASL